MSRRGQIKMTSQEVDAFLEQQRVLVCATNGPRGWPHLMPLWYLVRDGELWAWTYAKSQKVRNLERDARATLQIEAGVEYHELRGVMIEARTMIHRELEEVAQFGASLFERYGARAPDSLEVQRRVGGQVPRAAVEYQAIRAQAAKRVALQFVQQRIATWDHRKLGGAY